MPGIPVWKRQRVKYPLTNPSPPKPKTPPHIFNKARYSTSRAYNGILWGVTHAIIKNLTQDQLIGLLKAELAKESQYMVEGMGCWEPRIIEASLAFRDMGAEPVERRGVKEGLLKILRRYYGYEECKGPAGYDPVGEVA
ncbi:hypothetical protein TWF281_001352 [Arthrobotrys megalospora]